MICNYVAWDNMIRSVKPCQQRLSLSYLRPSHLLSPPVNSCFADLSCPSLKVCKIWFLFLQQSVKCIVKASIKAYCRQNGQYTLLCISMPYPRNNWPWLGKLWSKTSEANLGNCCNSASKTAEEAMRRQAHAGLDKQRQTLASQLQYPWRQTKTVTGK